MLKRLRRQFVTIIMVLVGGVLVAVLGSSFFATRQAQHAVVQESLRLGLYDSGANRQGSDDPLAQTGQEGAVTADGGTVLVSAPVADGGWADILGVRRDDSPRAALVSLVIEVDATGTLTRVVNARTGIDGDALVDIVAGVVTGDATEGYSRSLHLAWNSLPIGGGTRIAVVDTSSTDDVLMQLAINDLQIIVVALLALLGISRGLATWALRPVEQAWEQQRRFVADASHELKTPLAVMLANTQILERDSGLSEDARRWVSSTADEAVQMKALVNDLLQLARADEQDAPASTTQRAEVVDLSEMVESAALEFDAVAFERGCSVEAEVDGGIRYKGDPEQLGRLVRILIDNAIKYAEGGTEIGVRLSRFVGHPTLSVHNEGRPIDAEDLPHVFERFYRSDKARTRDGAGGYGLGLAIAKSIAEGHGGSISVTSGREQGTTFTVRL